MPDPELSVAPHILEHIYPDQFLEEAHGEDALADVALRLVNRVEYKVFSLKSTRYGCIIQDDRKKAAAKRKTTQEEKESPTNQEEPSPEPIVQGAHQAAQDADIEVGPHQEEPSTLTSLHSSTRNTDEGMSIVDTPAQASVRGAVEVEIPTEDRVSDTPQPVIDVESPDQTVTIKDEGSLSTVQEAAAIEEKSSPPTPTTPSSTPALFIQDVSRPRCEFSNFERGFWIIRYPNERSPSEGIRLGSSEMMGA
ncbi:hypothetical protein PHMEG_00015896 [Phytophthora megakarya]|uniref:Uncharacterized protein n=1 Tax=Phytophthora megakarya TaxID=4795 RepID=A0A225W187_9STRA|nr:hypothetical protein PHMEG_00015896 [Phytophthora megakarya]